MNFHRKAFSISFQYCIDGTLIDRVTEIKDLSVTFDKKICFICHIYLITSKAFSMLGFLMRVCNCFDDPKALTIVYTSQVRSHLEYASVIWHPNYQIHIDRMASIQ